MARCDPRIALLGKLKYRCIPADVFRPGIRLPTASPLLVDSSIRYLGLIIDLGAWENERAGLKVAGLGER